MLNYLIGLVICIIATYYSIKFLGAHAAIVVALWGALLAKPILDGLISIYRFFRDAPLKPYQGTYYAFDGHQVRVFEINNALWVVDDDILNIIGLTASESARRVAILSEHRLIEKQGIWVYSEQALMRLVQDSAHTNAARLKFWLQREVYFPYSHKSS